MNTMLSILLERECAHAEQLGAGLRAVTDEIFRPPPKDELRILRDKRAQLEAKLNDTDERIALLSAPPPSDEYIERLAADIGADAALLKSAHQSTRLTLSGRPEYDSPVAQEF